MSDFKIEKIHKASIEILENIGIEFQDEEVLDILRKNNIKVDNDRAYFTEKQIEDYVSMAPSAFTVYARNEEYNLSINTNDTEYSPGYGCAMVADIDGNVREATLDDYLKFAKLVHVSDAFKINGGILVQPGDLDPDLSHAIMFYSTIKSSDKCIMSIPGSKDHFQNIIDLASIVFGGKYKLKEKPRLVTLISTLSPMKVDKNALESLKLCCEYNQPMVITPGPMAGATGPISLAGNIAMGNAELLATIALSQIINPGTPVIHGLVCTTSNMKTGNVSIGSPGFGVQAKYGAMLAKKYNLPNRSGGAVNDANGLTVQSGYETMLSMFVAHNERSNFVIHSAGILDSFSSMSYEKFLIDLEIISMLKYYFNDISVDEDSLAIDILAEVVESGQFLTHKHTLKRCRKDPWNPTVSVRGRLKEGMNPQDMMNESIEKRMKKMLSKYEAPKLDENLEKELTDYMLSIGVDKETLDRI